MESEKVLTATIQRSQKKERKKMFRQWYMSLSQADRRSFCKDADVKQGTVKNGYLAIDPLKRTMPRPESLARMVIASRKYGKITLDVNAMRGYFFDEVVQALVDEHDEMHGTERSDH
ncbi:hypothetical protein J7384_17285 [Endozoicomonas sp. G2_1]|uniref:hypothetical protein n=1 Tax=Endozoicomonas sp. G2_1 TaxID=2821091 RepID=UPI001ADAE887|nr:hypothetical protein [Endozoicomonas sp. G2_1]MBO9492119.1 hypothetical protein [Endozoicomonas sp. G2_1]